MALDLDAIRKKLSAMSGNRVKRLKIVDDKLFKLRIIAFPDNDGQPFKERLVYSIGREWNLLAPYQFDKPDPIKELTDKLRDRIGKSEEQAKEDWLMAKELFARVKHHAIVIDRANEAEGPMIWTFSRNVAKRLYGIMLDEEYGDITDPETGTDLKVRRTKSDNGFREYTIDPARRESALGTDDQVNEWMDNLPTIDGLYKEKSYEELDQILLKYMAGDDGETTDDTFTTTERGGKPEESGSSTDDTEQSFGDLDEAFKKLADGNESV